MAKREIPIFLIDTSRTHKKGECDWIFCSDKDNAFVARVDLLNGSINEVGEDYRTQSNGKGISARISILRYYGSNINDSNVRSLLKKALDYYFKSTTKVFSLTNPSRSECVKFIDTLIRSNLHNLDAAGSDYTTKQNILTSMAMLQASADYLKENENK